MIFCVAIIESWPRAFEHVQNMFVDNGILDSTAGVSDAVSIGPVDGCVHDLLRVTDYRDVWIMRDHDDLAAFLHCPDDRDEQVIDSLIVEIFFGLIDS